MSGKRIFVFQYCTKYRPKLNCIFIDNLMRGEGQRLVAQLTAASDEIERLKDVYSKAIERLEAHSLPNLTPQSAAQWFEMVRPIVPLMPSSNAHTRHPLPSL
jgi:hypothetical protein